jgi:hypothetical protein
LQVPATTSIQPTLYHYSLLIDRAKQLTATASQIEQAMLRALEQFDDRTYGLLRARQDLSVAQATVRLQDLKVKEAMDGAKLATLQRKRVDIQIAYFKDLIATPKSDLEQQQLDLLSQAAKWQGDAATSASGGKEGGDALRSAWQAQTAAWYSTQANQKAVLAAYERRAQDWQYQLDLANQDAAIGDEQVTIANDGVDVATQEQSIAALQSSNATDVVEFLVNEFTSPQLYEWMSGVLQGIYGFFLRQATAVARLAENQLAFERQEVPQAFIQADYWAAPTDSSSSAASAPDRKGLTGAERLLEDITQLDQYGFLTDTRKLQLTRTISLGRLAPAEFQQFRDAGVLAFATPMELFDRDFPGHYLRLIKRVKISVIALVPPDQGISATLSNNGLSRVVIAGDSFQTVSIRRDPESVALTSPMNAGGVFEILQSDSMLLPFEDTGVDTNWEFRLERVSNFFDYQTIFDVLITIDYTALYSSDYRRQVIQQLGTGISADRPYSFRNQLADQWYDLHNPDQSATPMTVRFTTFAADFPPNIEDLHIQQVLLYFSRADGKSFEVPVSSLRFTADGSPGAVGGGASSVDGTISTRRGNAGSWLPMIGKSPFGVWELALPNSEEMKARFNDEDIEDILFVITYQGATADWAA